MPVAKGMERVTVVLDKRLRIKLDRMVMAQARGPAPTDRSAIIRKLCWAGIEELEAAKKDR